MKKVCVDFDNTLARTVRFPYHLRITWLNRLVWKYVRHLKRRGYVVILNTLRHDEALEFAVGFCEAQDIPIDYVNENYPPDVLFWGHDSRKIGCDLNIDDRNVGLLGWLLRTFG